MKKINELLSGFFKIQITKRKALKYQNSFGSIFGSSYLLSSLVKQINPTQDGLVLDFIIDTLLLKGKSIHITVNLENSMVQKQLAWHKYNLRHFG